MICAKSTSATAGPSKPRTFATTCSSSYAMSDSNVIFPFSGPAPVTAMAVAPSLHQRELYLRALEQEREEILAETYAAKRSHSEEHLHEDDEDEDEDEETMKRFDERGRQLSFRETVRQRQARLEFLRRQDFARRLAHRGLESRDPRASAYAIKRLPPPRVRPIERVNAAINIQRAWRLHAAVKRLEELRMRVAEAREAFVRERKEDYEGAWRRYAETLHELLRELGERTGVLSSQTTQSQSTTTTKTQTLHPRVRVAARAAMESLREELMFLDRAQVQVTASSSLYLTGSFSSSSSSSSISSNSDSEEEFDEECNEEYYFSDSDSEDEDEDEYASYTYTPPTPPQSQFVSTHLYVVDEEDEDTDPDGITDHEPISITYSKSWSSNPKTMHQRTRHATLSFSIPNLPSSKSATPVSLSSLTTRSPLARSPSLASIPEDEEEEEEF